MKSIFFRSNCHTNHPPEKSLFKFEFPAATRKVFSFSHGSDTVAFHKIMPVILFGETMDKHVFAVERLENFIESVLVGLGVTTDHARICSQRMIEADLRGMHGHR